MSSDCQLQNNISETGLQGDNNSQINVVYSAYIKRFSPRVTFCSKATVHGVQASKL